MGSSFPEASRRYPLYLIGSKEVGGGSIPEPINVSREIQCSDWPDLSHTPSLESVGGANLPELHQSAVLQKEKVRSGGRKGR